MMKKRNALLLILLTLCVLFSVAPVTLAEEAEGIGTSVAVASVSGVEYSTLADAISEAPSGSTILILDDITLTDEPLTIPAGKTLTIDLNGNIIAGSSTTAAAYAMITVQGTLTVKDSGSGGRITYTPVYPDTSGLAQYSTNTITNLGTLILNSGIIENTGGTDTSYPIDALSADGRSVSTTIHNGEVKAYGKAYAIRQWGSSETSANTVTINNGKISGYRAIWVQLPGSNNTVRHPLVSLTINGGELTSLDNTYNSAIYCRAYGNDGYANTTITITGGTINGDVALSGPSSADHNPAETVSITGGFFNSTKSGIYTYSSHLTGFIRGGSFTIAPADESYLAEGYRIATDNSAEYPYTVVESSMNANVSTSTAGADVKTDGAVGDPEQIINAAAAVAGAVASGLEIYANSAVEDLFSDATAEDDALAALENANITPEAGEELHIHVQTYLDIELKAVDSSPAGEKTLTLNIKPMVQQVASYKESSAELNTNANAVVLASNELTVRTPVTVTIPLPAGFAADGDTLYIIHDKGNGKTFIYEGTVNEDAGDLYLSFTNPNGFSLFTVSGSNPAVAKIGEVGYASFADAVAAVAEDETIILLADCSGEGTATVQKTITFTVTGIYEYSIAAGANTTMLSSDVPGGIEYAFTHTAPARPSGDGSHPYDIIVKTEGLTANPRSAYPGSTVTVTVDEGYAADNITVLDANGKEVPVSFLNGTYSFTMPESAVTVSAADDAKEDGYTACDDGDTCPTHAFTDIPADAEYHNGVHYTIENGLMNGISATEFSPDAIATRAQAVTVLWRLAGMPAENGSSNFVDAPADSWYADAACWAKEEGIVFGSNGKFDSNAAITREQFAVMLFRYAIYSGMDIMTLEENLTGFADADMVGEYSVMALNWAVGRGIITGIERNGTTYLSPQGTLTRQEIATFMMLFSENTPH